MSKSKKREMEKVWMERALKAEVEVEVLKSRVAGLKAEIKEWKDAHAQQDRYARGLAKPYTDPEFR